VTGLGSTFESVYGFSLKGIHRIANITDPINLDIDTIHDGVGANSPILSHDNAMYFNDPGLGPMKRLRGQGPGLLARQCEQGHAPVHGDPER
jgi:hypothetical protein